MKKLYNPHWLSDAVGVSSPEARAQRKASREEQKAARAAVRTDRGPVLAKYAVTGFSNMRLYADGTIESSRGSGSALGATARVDQSGSKRVFRDTRQAYLTIEGPRVAIAVKISPPSSLSVQAARRFAAQVNQWAAEHATTGQTVAAAGVADEISKLAELRDRGVLTDQEFQAKKAELLKRDLTT